METPETETQYFIVIDGQKAGPFHLAALIDAGMEANSLVWWDGLESWPRACKIPKLAALLKAERQRRIAVRRAERMPDPEPIRRLGWVCLLPNLPAAVAFLVGGTLLWTALVLWIVAASSAGPQPLQVDAALVRTAFWLLVIGVCATVVAVPLFILEVVLLGRLVWQCRAVVSAAAPSPVDASPSLDLSDLTELGNVDMGGPSLPTFDWQEALFIISRPGGVRGGVFFLGGGILFIIAMIVLMVGPMAFCLLRPQMIGHVVTVTVVLAVYAVVHVPLMIAMLFTIHRPGYGLNHIIDLYQLYQCKVPWAPIGVGFWTALCSGLLMAGPFSLAFFILLAIWVRRTSETAARIGDPDAREIIATPLPTKAAEKAAPQVPGSWSEAKG